MVSADFLTNVSSAGGKGTEDESFQRDDESLDVNDNESAAGPICEETSVIEYHSSQQTRRNFTDALELAHPIRCLLMQG